MHGYGLPVCAIAVCQCEDLVTHSDILETFDDTEGVQGMMDLTVPGRGMSSIIRWPIFVDGMVDVSEVGVMKRML